MTGKWMIDPLTKTVSFRWNHLSEKRPRVALAGPEVSAARAPLLRLLWVRGLPRRAFGDLAASAGG